LRFLKKFLQENLPLPVKLFLKGWLAKASHPSSRKVLTRGESSGSKGQPAILVCDERIPSPDRDAGSARMFLILEALAKSHHIVFLPFNRPQGIEYEQALWELGIETGNAVDYRHLIKQRGFAAAILSRPAIAGAMLGPVRRADQTLPIIYDMLDVHHLRSAREAVVTRDPRAARESKKLRRLETRVARGADIIWCGSSPDQKLMLRIAPNVPSIVVPTVHRLHGRGPTFGEREQLLFIGNFSHRPNVDAIHFLAREILPLIRKSLPRIELLVVGDNAPPEFAEYTSSGLQLLGYVSDLNPIFAGCRVSVAPIRFGSGVNGKIGEALSYGLPVVTNTIGAEGWGFTDGDQVLIADAPDDFAAAVVRLYENAELWQKLSDNGYRHIAENYTPEVVGQVINESVRQVVRRTASRGSRVSDR
jgi:glycosyltransferase involved in cell wall biosynthesis